MKDYVSYKKKLALFQVPPANFYQQKMISKDQMLYNMTMFRLLLSFFAYLPVDVIIFCMWRISHFPCILKPLYFNKSCSVHKQKPQVYNLGMVGKNLW